MPRPQGRQISDVHLHSVQTFLESTILRYTTALELQGLQLAKFLFDFTAWLNVYKMGSIHGVFEEMESTVRN